MSPSQSARLPPPPPPSVQSVQSVSELRRHYLMVFIYTFHVGFLMPCPPPPAPPLDVVLSTPRAFSLWAILGGFMVGPDLPLISFRSILKQETETGRLRPPPHSSATPPQPLFLFLFRTACAAMEASRGKEKKSRKMKVNMCVCGCGRSEHHLTGGAQLANHRGSCDAAGVASATFQQNGKLALRRPLGPLNRRSAATWVNVQPVVLLLLHQTP